MKYIEKIISIFTIIIFCMISRGPLEAELKNENKIQNNIETSAMQDENFQENKDLNLDKETKSNETKKEKIDNKSEPNSNLEEEKDAELNVKTKEEPYIKNEQISNGNHFSILILEAIGSVLMSVCYTLDRIIRVADETQEFMRIYLMFFPPNENRENEVEYNQ